MIAARQSLARELALALAAMLAGCSGGERPVGLNAPYKAKGLATWYGQELAGRPTASGERFVPSGITAAHRTLPLGSMVEVTDLATGRAILVRVNDRGPRHRDRLIDLSQGAAHLLGTDRRSPAEVRLRRVSSGGRSGDIVAPGRAPDRITPAPPRPVAATGRYLVQIASFADEGRARALADRLAAQVSRSGDLWRVRLGPYSADEAQRARDVVARAGYADAILSATD